MTCTNRNQKGNLSSPVFFSQRTEGSGWPVVRHGSWKNSSSLNRTSEGSGSLRDGGTVGSHDEGYSLNITLTQLWNITSKKVWQDFKISQSVLTIHLHIYLCWAKRCNALVGANVPCWGTGECELVDGGVVVTWVSQGLIHTWVYHSSLKGPGDSNLLGKGIWREEWYVTGHIYEVTVWHNSYTHVYI